MHLFSAWLKYSAERGQEENSYRLSTERKEECVSLHTFSAALTARHNALVLLVERPAGQAFAADAIADARLAALVAGQALQALLVGIVTIGTVVQAFVLPGIARGSTGDAVLLCGTVACGTRRVTIGASTEDLIYQCHLQLHHHFALTCSPLSHTCPRDKPSSICSHA